MRVVVTGASGNVGSQLLPQLLSAPGVTSVVGLCRRPPSDPSGDVEWRAADVAEDDLVPVFRGADVVVHLAWLLQPAHDPDEMHRVNVTGTRRVVDAVVAAGVPALVHASSVGAYAPGPKAPRPAGHPTTGVPTSTYSRHKAAAERLLDVLERDHPERRVVRLRKGIVLQPQAASALARYFLGPFVPQALVRPSLLPVVPAVPGFAVQAVHAEDAARAYVLAVTTPVTGAFDVAAGPVIDGALLAEALGARRLPVPQRVARAVVEATWRLHLQPMDPGWVDIALQTPLLDPRRAHEELGWQPRHDALTTLRETVEAIGRREGGPTPVLAPRRLPGRALELARALVPGARGTG